MNDLGPKELELLSALKASDEPAAEDRERIRRRVWLAVGLAAVGTSGAGIGTQTAVAATQKVGFFAATTAKVGLVVGLASGGAVLATQPWSNEALTRPSETASRVVDTSEHPTSVVVPAINSAPLLEPSAQPERETASVSRARAKREAPSFTPSARDLDAEIELLHSARQSLQAGQWSGALDKLNEHARRFPKGILASERQASVAIALCRSGDVSAGKTRALRYLSRNPKSPLADRVRASCKFE
jgi:hypothetical protein